MALLLGKADCQGRQQARQARNRLRLSVVMLSSFIITMRLRSLAVGAALLPPHSAGSCVSAADGIAEVGRERQGGERAFTPVMGVARADEATSTERETRTDGTATGAAASAGATCAARCDRAQSGRRRRARQGEHATAKEAKTDGRRRARRRAVAEGRARVAPTPCRASSRGVPSAVPSSARGRERGGEGWHG